MAREVDHREQQIADLVAQPLDARAVSELGPQLGDLLLDLVEHRAGSGQSKPTRAARCCSLTARISAGSASGTSSSSPGIAVARPLCSPAPPP